MIKNMKKKSKKKGFTLVELIIVIAVIGILAAILVPTMISVIGGANARKAGSEILDLGPVVTSALTEAPSGVSESDLIKAIVDEESAAGIVDGTGLKTNVFLCFVEKGTTNVTVPALGLVEGKLKKGNTYYFFEKEGDEIVKYAGAIVAITDVETTGDKKFKKNSYGFKGTEVGIVKGYTYAVA